MRQDDERQDALVHAVGVVDPLGQHGVLDFLHQFGLGGGVCERVGGHVEEQEVLLLGGEDTLLNEVLGKALAHVAELVAQFQGVPGLA